MDTRRFFIKPIIPEKIKGLQELAFNVWSCWDQEAQRLFHRIDPQLFRSIRHNPVEFLYRLGSERLTELSKDKGFLNELKRVEDKFRDYLSFEGEANAGFSQKDVVAYLCMEYGLHESIPIYSGGLAILAGDLLKAASDTGFPMVGIGLLYRYGYFSQHITADGNQVEQYRENTWYLSAIQEVRDAKGNPLMIEVPLKKEKVWVKIWQVQVGRVPLYLLDANVHQNPPRFRKITETLYDPDRTLRLEQELILGRGAVIAMQALGIQPKIYHMNEGHTAFSIMERLLQFVQGPKQSLEEAKQNVRYSTVFTTHTPVIAGNEHFSDDLIREYLSNEAAQLGLSMDQFLSLGKVESGHEDNMFWLTALALRFSRHSNGVSRLHTQVSRKMWQKLFPNQHETEFPIDNVTNGVHLQTWLSLPITEIFDRYVGPDYLHAAHREHLWDKVDSIPDAEIWNAHCRRKEQVISFVRRRVSEMMRRRGYGKSKIKDVEKVMNPDALTIGFARRFVQYKRATLILHDPERLASILTKKERPVQIIFAGKAHPADGIGKGIIKEIVDFVSRYSLEHHVVFLEDYDIDMARHLVQGVDLWLNTPVKPMEASGTSGMKAGINGVLNLSILDGWWPECYDGENGWALTAGEGCDNPGVALAADANQFYELLENEIGPLFYEERDEDVPAEWVRMMKRSIVSVGSAFSMHRVMNDYIHKLYLPQMKLMSHFSEGGEGILKKAEKFRRRLESAWSQVHIRDYFTSIDGRIPVSNETVTIDCYATVGDVDLSLLSVEALYCSEDPHPACQKVALPFVEKYADKVAKFSGTLVLQGSGTQELSVRLVPSDPDFREVYPEYIKWKD
ncbi:MAG: alpha-glucan family phosphorylase [bacterium]|nr:alpha-glucan family phosphorylase [bacterium]